MDIFIDSVSCLIIYCCYFSNKMQPPNRFNELIELSGLNEEE